MTASVGEHVTVDTLIPWRVVHHRLHGDPSGRCPTNADGSVGRTVIAEEILEEWNGIVLYFVPIMEVDVNGLIHIAMYEGAGSSTVRHLMLGP